MRVVMIGASTLAVAASQKLLENGHEVVIIEQDETRIEELADELDCGFVCGDGSRPSVLRDVSPENTNVLFCLSNSDQDNIIAALVGRKLGFERTVAHVKDPEFASICAELDIDDVVIPDQHVGRALAHMVEGTEGSDLLERIGRGVQLLSFAVTAERAGTIADLDLPAGVTAIVRTRQDESVRVDAQTRLKEDDQLLFVADEQQVDALKKRFRDDDEESG